MGYRIGSFNLRNLGFSAIDKKENKRNLRKIAEIIRNEKFDVIALQEILSEGKAFVYEKETVKKNMEMTTDISESNLKLTSVVVIQTVLMNSLKSLMKIVNIYTLNLMAVLMMEWK